jgi:hypothetical protein
MLSKTSKLGCLSWSLQAFETCPGSVVANAVVDACKFCYARVGMYHMPDVKALRARNKEDWQGDDWVSRMVAKLSKQTHFRWFDSGDMYSLSLAEKILDVMRQTPHVKHWLPTRMHKSYKQGGKCLSCRACWDKSVSVVSYPYHGRSLAKVIKIVKAA